jgi:RNA-binding protein Musashi
VIHTFKMADENYEDDIFDDLYDDEPTSQQAPAASAPAPKTEPEPPAAESASAPPQDTTQSHGHDAESSWPGQQGAAGEDTHMDHSGPNAGAEQSFDNAPAEDDNYGPINVKEDGKMFIGGLNWETTEDSLKGYFSQFGEVSECTVMRDSATGRSRGFGFLTFKDPKCVNIVMVKEHYLDGKIIDPKRAIPREEQERTSKIFVGGVSQEATEEDFTNFFKQFGRVVDATLMMDKETGRPRGFGFVTFDGDAAVDATLRGPLQILGKPIEVKRAQPRGNMRDDENDGNKKFGRGNKFNKFNDGGNGGQGGNGYENSGNMQAQGGNTAMSPAMMAQYWQRMQQYFQSMQQTLAQQQANGGMAGNPMGGMGGMNPMQMQQMQQQMMNQGMNRGTGSPNPQMMGGMGGMNPMQMQQMQMQQMQGGGGPGGPGGPGGMNPQGGQNAGPRPAYTAQDQLAFEQQKYEQQQARRQQQLSGPGGWGAAQGSGPASWDGMYDDAPPPNVPSGPSGGRGGGFRNNRSRQGSSQPPGGQAPINAPTGPKNAGVRGANYRGGGHRGGGGFRHQPYGGRGG